MKKTEDSNGHGVICGSRAHLESDSIASRSLFRTILMFGFHLCVKVFGCRTIKDTQCGFKLFTRNTSRIMFKSCHIGKRHALKNIWPFHFKYEPPRSFSLNYSTPSSLLNSEVMTKISWNHYLKTASIEYYPQY